MTLQRRFAMLGLLWVFALPMLSQGGDTPTGGNNSRGMKKRDHQNAVPQGDGERKFAQNCSRCHTPPESFSPHISATIVRHMRIRASLSKQDEEDILHFLNP